MEPEALDGLALHVARARSVNTALSRIAEGLVSQPHVALARVWLAGPGDLCSSCGMRRE